MYGKIRLACGVLKWLKHKLETRKVSFNNFKNLLSLFVKRGKSRGLGVLFGQRFRKYFPRRNYGRKFG